MFVAKSDRLQREDCFARLVFANVLKYSVKVNQMYIREIFEMFSRVQCPKIAYRSLLTSRSTYAFGIAAEVRGTEEKVVGGSCVSRAQWLPIGRVASDLVRLLSHDRR